VRGSRPLFRHYRPSFAILPQCLDDQACCGSGGVLLLAGEEQPVRNGGWAELAVDDEVGIWQVACLVLDAERLDLLPYEGVRVVLLGVG